MEEKIGNPLSPYAVTKWVNELYANVFARIYKMELIGLRYFNVFGPRQDPNGAYAAVIPRFTDQLLKHRSPIINGDGNHSRDFTFVENVVQANLLAVVRGGSRSSQHSIQCCLWRTDYAESAGAVPEKIPLTDRSFSFRCKSNTRAKPGGGYSAFPRIYRKS